MRRVRINTDFLNIQKQLCSKVYSITDTKIHNFLIWIFTFLPDLSFRFQRYISKLKLNYPEFKLCKDLKKCKIFDNNYPTNGNSSLSDHRW